VLGSFYARYERTVGDGRFKQQAEKAERDFFPNGMERVSLRDFSASPSEGVEVLKDTNLAEALGVRKGMVIGALDGYRVRDFAQYRFVRGLTRDPKITLIVWDGRAWKEVLGRFRLRMFGSLMQTFKKS
jgi:hypothetical protein